MLRRRTAQSMERTPPAAPAAQTPMRTTSRRQQESERAELWSGREAPPASLAARTPIGTLAPGLRQCLPPPPRSGGSGGHAPQAMAAAVGCPPLGGRTPLLAASDLLFQYSYTTLASQNKLYSSHWDSLPPAGFHIASGLGIHLCRQGKAIAASIERILRNGDPGKGIEPLYLTSTLQHPCWRSEKK